MGWVRSDYFFDDRSAMFVLPRRVFRDLGIGQVMEDEPEHLEKLLRLILYSYEEGEYSNASIRSMVYMPDRDAWGIVLFHKDLPAVKEGELMEPVWMEFTIGQIARIQDRLKLLRDGFSQVTRA